MTLERHAQAIVDRTLSPGNRARFMMTVELTAKERTLEGQAYNLYHHVNDMRQGGEPVPTGLTDRLYDRYLRREERTVQAWRRAWEAVNAAAEAHLAAEALDTCECGAWIAPDSPHDYCLECRTLHDNFDGDL